MKEARATFARLLLDMQQGTYTEPSKLMLGSFLGEWLAARRPNIAPRTYDAYANNVRNHIVPALGDTLIRNLSPLQIQTFYTNMLKELEPSTVLQIHRALSSALRYALKLGHIVINPIDRVTPPRPARRIRYVLSDDDEEMILKRFSKSRVMYLPVAIALDTGMRIGEVAGLQWQDVDLVEGYIHVRQTYGYTSEHGYCASVPKSRNSVRHIAIPKRLHATLSSFRERRRPAGDDYVCINMKGRPVKPTDVSTRFTVVMRELGLDVKFHGLRHSHASKLCAKGVSPALVAERLGDAIQTVMSTYVHNPHGLQKYMIDKLDEERD